MPISTNPRELTVSLVAVPERSAAIIYGMHEIFACVGVAWEILTGERNNSRQMTPRIVGSSKLPMQSGFGVTLVPDHSFDEAHKSNVVIVGDLNLNPDAKYQELWSEAIDWLKDQYDHGAIICSVCTGAVMLAEAGLLDHHEATTHWSTVDLFRRCYPKVVLKAERILVPSGDAHRIVTSGGSASWSDLALYLIARFCGDGEARRIAKIFLFGDRSNGQMPFAAMVRPRQHDDGIIAKCQEWIAEQYAVANPVASMAERSGLNARTFKRRFKSATGYAPLDYVQTLRIEEAKQMLETTENAIDEIASQVGYEEPNSFRRLFKRTTGISPHQYRMRFKHVVTTRSGTCPASLPRSR